MKKDKLKLAIAQLNLSVGDFEGNSKKIIDHINLSFSKKCDVVIFPELAVCGYPPEDLLLKPHFIKENEIYIKKIAKKTPKILTLIGLAHRENGSLYNSCAVIYNKKIYSYYHKKLLPNYAVFDEKRYFEEGKEHFIIKYADAFIGVNICEDIWHKEGPFSLQRASGTELIINISASPYYKGKIKVRRNILAERSKESGGYLAYCNLVGGQDELVFDGGSLVLGPKGKVVSQGYQFKEDFLLVDLDLKRVKKKSKFTFYNMLPTIDIPFKKVNRRTAIKNRIVRPLKEEEEVYEALKLGLADYVNKNHFKKVVVGLSGGIDSALCATLAVDALGKENVTAVTMPSHFTSFGTLNDAIAMAKKLKVDFYLIPIDSLYGAYLDSLKGIFAGRKQDSTEENIQARIRGNILMAISNKFGYLLLTTGNKSETSVGYCTLYGDLAGGFAALKDVPKTLVYKLAKYRNSLGGKNIIPSSIIKRAPSAELKKNQRDQDALPPYDILDKILKLYVEEDKSLKQIIKSGFNKGLVKEVINMVDKNEYKRRQSPPGIRITPKAFGKDRRMPISNQYTVK